MFTKRPEASIQEPTRTVPLRPAAPTQVAAARAPRAQTGGGGSASLIGADLSITGNLESRGEVQVEGEVQGDIRAQRVVVGEQARIVGGLIAEEVVVRGSVQGTIRGNSVVFQASSRVEGDVFHRSFAVEQGAFFEGKSRRSEDPMSAQRAAVGLPPPAAA